MIVLLMIKSDGDGDASLTGIGCYSKWFVFLLILWLINYYLYLSLFITILSIMTVSKKLINMRKVYKAFNALYYVIVIVFVILLIVPLYLYMEYTGDSESIVKTDTKEL